MQPPERNQNQNQIPSIQAMTDHIFEDQQEETVKIPTFDLNSLKFLSLLGRGAKGVVFRVRSPDSDEDLALKVVLKNSLKSKNRNKNSGNSHDREQSKTRRIWFEREVLKNLRHPLLPKLRGVLETENVVGYAIDYCPGKDLNSVRRLQSEKMFSDDIIRFYGAELVVALEYLHKSGIVYRDLKPENVLIQENGHLMLVDFDLSTKLAPRSPQTRPITPESESEAKTEPPKKSNKVLRWINSDVSPPNSESSSKSGANSVHPAESDSVEKSNSFVGTEDYVAPEVVVGKGHDYAVDFWCLGVVLYEMLYGTTPFRGVNRKETFCKIVSRRPDLVGETTPLRDLIGRLLEKDPMRRIQLEEIKGHDFFRGVDWEMIWRIQRPPFIPLVEEDMEGIKGVDVERIVHGIFEGKSGGDDKGWVEGFDQRPSESDNFLVY